MLYKTAHRHTAVPKIQSFEHGIINIETGLQIILVTLAENQLHPVDICRGFSQILIALKINHQLSEEASNEE